MQADLRFIDDYQRVRLQACQQSDAGTNQLLLA